MCGQLIVLFWDRQNRSAAKFQCKKCKFFAGDAKLVSCLSLNKLVVNRDKNVYSLSGGFRGYRSRNNNQGWVDYDYNYDGTNVRSTNKPSSYGQQVEVCDFSSLFIYFISISLLLTMVHYVIHAGLAKSKHVSLHIYNQGSHRSPNVLEFGFVTQVPLYVLEFMAVFLKTRFLCCYVNANYCLFCAYF